MTTHTPFTANDADSLSVIETDLATSIYVEAGAGTGKTHSLVQRITSLLKSGVPIEQIIAITFTRAAASELRSRIRGELELLQVKNPDNAHVDSALRGIDTAAFQTIDSLVYSILREHPLEAGLPPVIEVQDNFSQLQTFRDRWRQWSVERLDEKDGDFATILTAALRMNLSSPFQRVSELAKSMNGKHGDLRKVTLSPPPDVAIQTVEYLSEQIGRIRETKQGCIDAEDKLYAKFDEVVDWYDRSVRGRRTETEHDAQELLATWPKITPGGSGTAGNWGGRDGKAEASQELQSFADAIDDAMNAAREAVTINLAEYAKRFVNTVVQERRRSGSVSYYDAITWLIDLLKKNDRIRRSVQSRYRHVLVDEFQDTDPNQVRLVRLLTIPPGEKHIKPGSLFIVGDPKQSIYRFRGAQVTVSQAVKDDVLRAEGKHLKLRENRRSTRSIIDWVNHVFGKWMPSEPGQADYIALDRAKETAAPDDFGRVYHFGAPLDVKVVGEVRQIDAEQVATIARAVCAGKLEVRDRRNGGNRPSRAGDLTILTNVRSNWETYTNELDRYNLSYSAEMGGSAVLKTQEFRDLLNCLTAMDDPSDQPATVGALKSVFFGCSDRDLFEWARSGGTFSCAADFPKFEGESNVGHAMHVLRQFSEIRDETLPAALIERFVRERQTRELMYLESDATPGLRRLDLAVELARRFTEEGALSLRECLKRFDEYKEANQDLREEPSLEYDQGKIRLMTMHASKGLEFPVVILADLCGAAQSNTPNLLTDDDMRDGTNGGVGIRIGGSKTSGYFQAGDYEELQEASAAADSLEKTRLLYVAATRARDYLFVSRNRKQKDLRTFAAQIEQYIGESNSSLWSAIPAKWQAIDYASPVATKSDDMKYFAGDRDAWLPDHRRVVSTAASRPWLSPSGLKPTSDSKNINREAAIEKPDDAPVSDSDDAIGRGRAATKIGSAVHAAIQRALETPNPDIDQIAQSEAERHGVREHVEEVCRLTKATLEMPLLKRTARLQTEDLWVEVPVAVPMPTDNNEAVTIEGRVDLVYRCADGSLGIADFKTDRSFDRSIVEMAEPYIAQLGAYAYAVQRASGMPVTEASILFSRLAADKRGDGEYQLQDVPSAIELALKLASSV